MPTPFSGSTFPPLLFNVLTFFFVLFLFALVQMYCRYFIMVKGPQSLVLVPAQGIAKRKVIKKYKGKIKRWHSHQFMKVGESWRKPKGIDGRQRRKFKGTGKQVNIGYGSDKKTRHVLPNGFYKFTVSNVKDLEMLMMNNRRYCAEIAGNVSSLKRKAIVDRAEQLNIRVTNGLAKLRPEENE